MYICYSVDVHEDFIVNTRIFPATHLAIIYIYKFQIALDTRSMSINVIMNTCMHGVPLRKLARNLLF